MKPRVARRAMGTTIKCRLRSPAEVGDYVEIEMEHAQLVEQVTSRKEAQG